jgi:hypothetical protein
MLPLSDSLTYSLLATVINPELLLPRLVVEEFLPCRPRQEPGHSAKAKQLEWRPAPCVIG